MITIRRTEDGTGYVFDETGAFIGIESELMETNPDLFRKPAPKKACFRDLEYSAFPFSPYTSFTGMTMREYYAALALVGILHSALKPTARPFDWDMARKFADAAFMQADAMVERSEKELKNV